MKKIKFVLIALFLGIVMAFGVSGCNVGTQNDLQNTIDDLQRRIEELEEQISERDATIEDLSELMDKLEEMQDRLAETEEQISDRDATIADLKELIKELEKLEDQVRDRDATIEDLNERIKSLKELIEQLEKEFAEKFPEYAESMGTFYTLQEAYDNGWLTKADLMSIAYYHNGGRRYNEEIMSEDYEPAPKVPEVLSELTELKIKSTEAKYCREKYEVAEAEADGITITQYCGTYGDCVAVKMIGYLMYTEALWTDTVAGVNIHYNNGNSIKIWRETNGKEDGLADELQDYVLKISANQQVYSVNEEIFIDITLENRSGEDVEIAYYFLFYPESLTGQFPAQELPPVTTKKIFENGEIIFRTECLGGCFPIGQHQLKFEAVFYLAWEMTEFGYETTDSAVRVYSNTIEISVVE